MRRGRGETDRRTGLEMMSRVRLRESNSLRQSERSFISRTRELSSGEGSVTQAHCEDHDPQERYDQKLLKHEQGGRGESWAG